jgi:RimJ/RimL family protein N-acetyltransferase
MPLAANSEPVFLRALDVSDVERTTRWHNERELYQTLVNPFRFVSASAEQAWICGKAEYSTKEINLAVCVRETGQHVGSITLRNIDWVARHGELGLLIGEAAARGKGFGRSAVRQLLDHAFSDLGLQRIYLYVLEANAPAIKVYESCGFVLEGRLRRHAFKDGALRDLLVMGLCRGDAR